MTMSSTPSESQAAWQIAGMETVDGPTQSAGSWIDQLQARLDRTSVGPGAVYGLVAVLLAAGLHLAHWLSGAYPGGRFHVDAAAPGSDLPRVVHRAAAARYGRVGDGLDQQLHQSPPALSAAVLGLLLTGAEFFLPLAGLHTELQSERHRLLSDARRRIQATLEELHQRIEAADLSSMQRMKDQLGSLLLEEDFLGMLRTWPWPPGLFLRVLGVIGLPIVLFVLQRVLQEWLGF
jgi:hypothetical protein